MFDEPTPALYIHIPPQKISHVRYGDNFFLVSRTVSRLLRLYPISAASSRFCLHDISFVSYHNPEARGLWLQDGGVLFTVAHSSPARLDTQHGFRFQLATYSFMSTSCHGHWRFAATASISPCRFLFLAAMLVADF